MTTVARVSGPADLAAAVPEVLGFTPTESLVAMSLHEPRGRLGLTMRFDLSAAEVIAAEVRTRLRRESATRTALLVFTDETGELPHRELVEELVGSARADGIDVSEALLVRAGLWRSYVCTGSCCPPQGTPLPRADTGTAGLMAAERVWKGGTLHGSRADLEASLAPVLPLGQDVRLAELAVAAQDLLDDVVADRRAAERTEIARLRWALRHPDDVDDQTAGRCVVALRLITVRDEVLSWVPRQAAAVQLLALLLCRRTPRPEAAALLTVLGAAAYAQGGGALARIALEGALRVDPDYAMAELLVQALDGQVPPAQVRRTLGPSCRRARR